jgi:DNA topoisomerase-3
MVALAKVLSVDVYKRQLAMVVDRFKEIENFKPQPYWELQTLYREILFSYEEGRFLKRRRTNLADKVRKRV